ncbi:MAG: LicD family protein [Ruminococcaceae bacterium]|nr:LicD family protein [Oscillospiraceae bacterium]
MEFKDQLSVEEQKKITLDILIDFAKFCDEHGIRYFLAYGTLIGAVRHKGYIPWDDDIDLQMPREDYNRLIEIYNKERNTPYYELVAPHDKKSRHSFVKIIDTRTVKIEPGIDYSEGYLGIDIDIFPIDGMPGDDGEFDAWVAKLKKTYRSHVYCVIDSKKNIKRRLAVPILRILSGGKEKVLNKADKMHALYPYGECEYVGTMESSFNSPKNRVKKEYFDGYTMVQFEGYEFKAPSGYHEILTNIFGDYMTPPADQTTHHTNKTYWIDKGEN